MTIEVSVNNPETPDISVDTDQPSPVNIEVNIPEPEADIGISTIVIPTVFNGTLTISENSTALGTFSANQANDTTIDVTVPTKLTDLTNDLVGDATISFTAGDEVVGSFTTNASENVTIELPESSAGSSRDIGEIVQSAIPLINAGLHLLDGSLLQYGSYKAFIDYMADLYGDGTNIPDYFCSENDWQTSVTNYGSCDKYVYDSTNNTIRLPKRTSEHGALINTYSSGSDWYRIYQDGWCEQGGDYSSGSGNKTTNFLKSFIDTNYFIGFFVNYSSGEDGEYPFLGVKNASYVTYRTSYAYGGGWKACGYIDISDYQYSPIYEYLVIANSTKTEIEVDIDEVMTDLNGKADKDLSNLDQNVYNEITKLALPGTTYANYSVQTSGYSYTAIDDGFITVASITGGVYVAIRNSNDEILVGNASNFVSGFGALAFIPVRKNQTFTVHYTNSLVFIRHTYL